MPLKINDEHFGDRDYYDKRRAMLGDLNKVATNAFIDYPGSYKKNHAIASDIVGNIKQSYPEQFADLQEQNTDAKIRALNELDFMDSDPKHANNPVAQLGAQDANTQLRMPLAWADQDPRVGDGRVRGFYTPKQDNLVIPMNNMRNASDRGINTLTHETMHRGFDKMNNPFRFTKNVPEHNYIYNKMLRDYPDTKNTFTKDQINTAWPTRPGFQHEPGFNQDVHLRQEADSYEKYARKRLGS